MIDYPDEQVSVAGVLGPLRLEDVLFAAGRSARLAPLQAVRTGAVLGAAHVRSAALHAHRAFLEKRNQADRLEVEFTRYLLGERQIRRALERAGVQDGAPSAVVVALGARRLDALRHFLHQLGLREDDRILEPDAARVRAWGFSDAELAATAGAPPERLALERVALADLA